jgi:hypothetical protein
VSAALVVLGVAKVVLDDVVVLLDPQADSVTAKATTTGTTRRNW